MARERKIKRAKERAKEREKNEGRLGERTTTFMVKSSDHGVEKFSLNEAELFPAIVCAYCCFT